MTQKYFQVIAHYQAKADEVDTVARLLSDLAAESRKEPQNLSYDFFQGVEDKAHFVILERYADAAGFAAHREYPHFQTIGAGQIIPRLVHRSIESYEGSADA